MSYLSVIASLFVAAAWNGKCNGDLVLTSIWSAEVWDARYLPTKINTHPYGHRNSTLIHLHLLQANLDSTRSETSDRLSSCSFRLWSNSPNFRVRSELLNSKIPSITEHYQA